MNAPTAGEARFVNVSPQDIAEAVLHFASGVRSSKSTGNVLDVDGGVPAAYTR